MEDANVQLVPETGLEAFADGVRFITEGYISYAEEVICNRAFPDLYDGLKPVNRRVLYSMYRDNKKRLVKSANIVGSVMEKYHPHSDSSIYKSFVSLVDKNGSARVPWIKGQGAFGSVTSNADAAAMRYTEVMLSSYSEMLFGEMFGIDYRPNFDATLNEPVVLPVRFPSVLVNSTSGMAVGFSSNIPSFNLVDVCNLVIEFINDGECSTVIEPDFVTGGYYVKSNKELMKLMKTGSARLKLRAKYERNVSSASALFYELPAGIVIESVLRRINEVGISALKDASNMSDFEHSFGMKATARSKNRADEMIVELFKKTQLQTNFKAMITLVREGVPVTLGVWDVIRDWVAWRRRVLIKEYNHRLEVHIDESRKAFAFMEIIKNPELKDELVNIVTHQGANKGVEFIKKNFNRELFDDEIAKWAVRRGLNEFHKGDKYEDQYAEAMQKINYDRKAIADPDTVILEEMKAIIAEYASEHIRRTEVTTVDYAFSDDGEEEEIIDGSSCAYTLKDGFIRKLRYYSTSEGDGYTTIEGYANDVLLAIDNRGRVIRIYCEDLPYTNTSDLGLYIARYAGLDETDDYRIMWIGRLTGEVLTLLYKDGKVGFLDTSEWSNNFRKVKVIEKGISQSSAHYLGAVLEEVPDILFVTDTSGRVAWVHTDTIKRKDRTARTSVFKLKGANLLDSYYATDEVSSLLVFRERDKYHEKMTKFDPADFIGDVASFIAI